jgi:iron complex outermembrane receptor protein
MNEFVMNERLTVTGGLRYDIGSLTVEGFHDPLLETYLLSQQMSATEASRYAQRAEELQRRFGDWSGALGIVYTPSANHTLRMHIGKSFRYPTAGELSSNGVHHGAFRHEQGNSSLNPERGIQWDGEYRYRDDRWEVTVSPFLSHFSNYIFLEPSGAWSILPHTGQIYPTARRGR